MRTHHRGAGVVGRWAGAPDGVGWWAGAPDGVGRWAGAPD
ncbi:putative protein without homology [Propionibacterium freudenreichii subsp. shermanii]|nr:putative protein without homology [Propionibacterium freudenreichii subsp. shermanii]